MMKNLLLSARQPLRKSTHGPQNALVGVFITKVYLDTFFHH